jgi:hypothetical protein
MIGKPIPEHTVCDVAPPGAAGPTAGLKYDSLTSRIHKTATKNTQRAKSGLVGKPVAERTSGPTGEPSPRDSLGIIHRIGLLAPTTTDDLQEPRG